MLLYDSLPTWLADLYTFEDLDQDKNYSHSEKHPLTIQDMNLGPLVVPTQLIMIQIGTFERQVNNSGEIPN